MQNVNGRMGVNQEEGRDRLGPIVASTDQRSPQPVVRSSSSSKTKDACENSETSSLHQDQHIERKPSLATKSTVPGSSDATPRSTPAGANGSLSSHERKRKRNRKRNKSKTHGVQNSPTDVKWHVPVNSKLKPYYSSEAASRVKDGKYHMTPEEQGTYEAKDRTKESTVTSLIQTDFSTALRLFSINYQNICTPVSVLADSGADLGLCISSRIAKRLGLTWTPGNAPLTGVGGLSILESRSNKDVVLRLGGDGREDDIETTPEGGCFTVRIQPNIMSEDTVAALGYECIMGQSLMWRSLASFDQFNETMEIAPAYVSSGCSAFCISIPCKMTTDRSPGLVSLFVGRNKQPFMNGFLPPSPRSAALAKRASKTPTPRDIQTPTEKPAPIGGLASIATRAIRAASQAMLDLLPSSRPSPVGTPSIRSTTSSNSLSPHNRPSEANPLDHEVKPTTGSTPSLGNRANLHAKWRHASHLVDPTPDSLALYKLALLNHTEPGELSYPIEELKRTGRLGANGELELGDGTSASVERAKEQKATDCRSMTTELGERVRKLETEIVALKRALLQARSAHMNTPNSQIRGVFTRSQRAPHGPRAPGSTPRPGTSRPGILQDSASLGAEITPLTGKPTGGADVKGKSRASPRPPKTCVAPPRYVTHQNQPLSIDSSPAEAARAQAEALEKRKNTAQDPVPAQQQGGPTTAAPLDPGDSSSNPKNQTWNQLKRERISLATPRLPETESSQDGPGRNQSGVSQKSTASSSSLAPLAVVAALMRLPKFKSTS
jgi:hypothetical protein